MTLDARAPLSAPIKKLSTVTNSTNLVARDTARLNHYFKKQPVEARPPWAQDKEDEVWMRSHLTLFAHGGVWVHMDEEK